MKTFLRFVLLSLILLSVVMVSALTAMRFAIHGREVAVPQLVGLDRADAERQANLNGLVLNVENHFYSAAVAEGKVISQSPAPGSLVRRGWIVRVADSLGPQRAEVPDLVGESARAAQINIQSRGLEVGSIAIADLSGAAPDEIVAQSPPATSGVVESPKINLLVAGAEVQQEFVMPNFVGKQVSEVRSAIEDAGFVLTVSDSGLVGGADPAKNPVSAKDTGIIVKQFPAAGQRIASGEAISFEIIH